MSRHPESLPLRLTKSGYQVRFLVRLYVIAAAGSVVLFAILYFALAQPLPETYEGSFHALRGLTGYLRTILTTSVLAYALLVFGSLAGLCIYWLHKVAGPLYRMERVFEGYRSGLPTRTVSFRIDDQIEPLATAFNDWIGDLRQDRQRWLAAMEEAERLCLQDEATCREHMKEALRSIEGGLSRYR
jgi:hypothetical protein